MVVCGNCRREMHCTKTGATCRWNEGHHVYSGDEFTCPDCGAKIIRCNENPWHQENPVIGKHDYIMDGWEPPETYKHRKVLKMRRTERESEDPSGYTQPNRNGRAYRISQLKFGGISHIRPF